MKKSQSLLRLQVIIKVIMPSRIIELLAAEVANADFVAGFHQARNLPEIFPCAVA